MDRLTEKTIGCFEYFLKDHEPIVGEFGAYDAFYDYSTAVKRLGRYEDTGLTPEEIKDLQEALGGKDVADWAVEAVGCRKEAIAANKMMLDCGADNENLRAQLIEANAQLQQAEAGLGEAVGVLERANSIMYFHAARCPLRPFTNFSGSESHLSEYRKVIEDSDTVLRSPAAKSGERVKAADAVYEALNDLYCLTNKLSIEDKDYRKVTNAAAALAAYEGVKGQ